MHRPGQPRSDRDSCRQGGPLERRSGGVAIQDPRAAPPRWRAALRWGVILWVALGIRAALLPTQALNMDEVCERHTAAMSIDAILAYDNAFPPLYHWLLKGWLTLDASEYSVRHLSLVGGLLSILAFAGLTRRELGEQTALWATGLAAVSPFHIFYSLLGRPYIFYILCATVALAVGMQLARQSTWGRRLALVGAVAAGAYLHYYFAITFAAIALSLWVWRPSKRLACELVGAGLAVAVLCLPLLPALRGDLTYQVELHPPRQLHLASLAYTWFSTLSGYTLVPRGPSCKRSS